MIHFLIYWTRPGWRRAFPADVHAATPRDARRRFTALFPTDCIVGVKEAKGWNGRTGQRGRWLA